MGQGSRSDCFQALKPSRLGGCEVASDSTFGKRTDRLAFKAPWGGVESTKDQVLGAGSGAAQAGRQQMAPE